MYHIYLYTELQKKVVYSRFAKNHYKYKIDDFFHCGIGKASV